MLNTLIGDLGHLSVIIAFVAATVAAYAYFMATRGRSLGQEDAAWQRLGRGAFLVHGAAVLAIIGCLFSLIYGHRYEYYYTDYALRYLARPWPLPVPGDNGRHRRAAADGSEQSVGDVAGSQSKNERV